MSTLGFNGCDYIPRPVASAGGPAWDARAPSAGLPKADRTGYHLGAADLACRLHFKS